VRLIAAVYAGEYETGLPVAIPGVQGAPIRSEDRQRQPDRTILELISHPAIGQWAAAITGAKMIQVFASQMLIKPPGGRDTGSVGWHQDQEYWEPALEGELLTAWVAISDVTAESGPMRFVHGSHHWGLLKAGEATRKSTRCSPPAR
jgi:hypothetical protein